MENQDRETVAKFLEKGRTIKEISEKLSCQPEDVGKIIAELQKDYDIFPTRNIREEQIFVARSKPIFKPVAPRIWTYTRAQDEYGRPQPYIIVRLPDDVTWPKVKIYPFGDLHFGAKGFDENVFNALMKLISQKEYSFLVMIGDLIENALGDSIGGAVYEQTMPPREQVLKIRELLHPIAHKTLLSTPGNHEWRSFKAANMDPIEFGFCEPLGIPYFSEPVHMDILWRGHVFTFYVRHGKGSAQTKGGKLNTASRPLSANEHTMFTIMGHVHDPISDKNVKRCREYIRDEEGNIVGMRVVKRTEHVVICSATYHHFGTYGSRAEYSPNATNLVHACVIEPNGKFRLEKKPLILEP